MLFSEAIRKKDADINFKMTDIQAQNLVIESMAAELLNGPLSDYFSRYGDINLNGIRDLYLGGRVSEAEYAPVGKIEEAIRELNATNSTLNPMMSDLIKNVNEYQTVFFSLIRFVIMLAFVLMLSSLLVAMKALRDINHHLETQVLKRTTELRASLDLREKLQTHMIQAGIQDALGRLVIGLAHELNTPLGTAYTAQSYFSERLEHSIVLCGMDDSESAMKQMLEMRDSYSIVSRSLDRAISLVQGMKQLARVEEYDAGSNFSPSECLVNLSTALRPVYLKDDTIRVVSRDDLIVSGDRNAFMQIVLLIFENAHLHARDPYRPLEIFCTVDSEDPYVIVTIRDNGPGFSAEALANAFAPFYSSLMSVGHNGLGLFICRHLASTLFGGSLTVGNAEPSGAEISIALLKEPKK